jgi:hypothetical protein
MAQLISRRHVHRVARALQLASLLATVASAGAAAQAAVDVPPACGSPAEFAAELEKLSGPSDAASWQGSVSIRALEDGSYSLELSAAQETRRLVERDCRLLFRSAVVMAAAALQNLQEAETPSAPGEPQHVDAPAAPAVEAAPRPEAGEPLESEIARPSAAVAPAPRTPPEPALAPVWQLALGAGLAAGSGPELAARTEMAVAYARSVWEMSLRALYVTPSSARAEGGRSVAVSTVGLTAQAGYWPLRWFGLRLGPELAWQMGRGRQKQSRDGTLRPALAAEVGVRLWPRSRLLLELALAGRYAFTRPRFEIVGFGTLYRSPALSGDALFRLGYRFR